MSPNRIALWLTAIADLAAGLAPFILDFGGTEQIVAYTSSILAANGVVVTWLQGWQKYEERQELVDVVGNDKPSYPPGE